MAEGLRVRVHVSEPFDFERENDASELFGWTQDAGSNNAGDEDGTDADEWEVVLDAPFMFNTVTYDRVLIGPRYMGEHLARVRDALLGVPVRIAHRTHSEVDGDGWHFAMTGMLSLAPPPGTAPPPTDDLI